MPLDPSAKRFLDLLAATDPQTSSSQSVEERRRSLEGLMRFGGPPQAVADVRDTAINGPAGPIPVRIYTPTEAPAEPMPALVYFHGGGLVAGDLDTHDGVSRRLARASGCRLFSVDYRLAPEHPFPAAIEDGYAVTAHLVECATAFGVDPNRVGVSGDSAGATIAAVVSHMAARNGRPKLAVQLLLCPITDYAGETESRRTLAKGYLVDSGTLEHDLMHYLRPGTDAADPRVSPLRSNDFSALPPTLVHTAEFDPLRDEGHDYAERLEAAGVATSCTCHPGMIHLFYAMGALIPYAHEVYRLIGHELDRALA